VRTSAGERAAAEDSGTLRNDHDSVDVTARTATDDGMTLDTTDQLNDRACRSSYKDPHDDQRPQEQSDVRSHQESLGHVTPPPSWSDRSMTSPEATRRTADCRFHVAPLPPKRRPPPVMPRPKVTRHPKHRENGNDVGITACSSARDDVLAATSDCKSNNQHSVNDDITEEKAMTTASTVSMTSFPASIKQSYVDVISRLMKKNVKRYTLELDLSTHSLFASLVRNSLPKPLSAMRKSTSCCELSAEADVSPDKSENQKSANSMVQTSGTLTNAHDKRPLLQLRLGQRFGVVCRETESGTSFAVVNVASGTQRSPSTDVEKRAESRDFNDNAAADEDKTQPLSRQPEPSYEDKSRTVAETDYFDVGVGCITDDVMQRSPSSRSRHERQLIFV